MALQLLPVDALDAVSCFLTGWDVFELSHVNAQCWRHFSRSTHWRPRLPSGSSKRTYAQCRSFAFEGLGLDERLSHCGGTDASGGVVVQGPWPRESFSDLGASFTVDAWFSLLDGERVGVLTGGVLFGGQSAMLRTCLWTNHHVAFVGVDGDRNLLCSVLEGGANCVAAGLDLGRWYHVALSFDCGVQKVFLDGELVSEMTGRLHHSWQELEQVQVGTGFVSSFWQQKSSFQLDTRPRSTRTFCGWHNLYGLVDEFRVWRTALSEREVQALAKCQDEFVLGDPWFSLQHAANSSASHPQRVSCTRSSERVVEIHRSSRVEWRLQTAFLECWQSLHNYLSWLPSPLTTR
ncbi:hypothetical protein PF010_g6828 [Phytophthora fragariae]|uniref:LamG-like jellyroll fold domain-containing protein n=1 Tax=Phytophthora fragariae TaxID=53985 RepID=A0A6A3LGG3_9STRA|nr:hypothetical protein PF011_g7850 [Phytophthora fragariae]KAE9122209.1 hypothetical protein PF010_g6828 [Phytophthora fragariae]KAE9213879.1 hypothetical protein PF004_g15205 [Phytophthora fragariae]